MYINSVQKRENSERGGTGGTTKEDANRSVTGRWDLNQESE